MEDIVVGIISYLPPSDTEKRNERLVRINRLLEKISEFLPNIPVMIIAQNWQGLSINKDNIKVPLTIYPYPTGLGINGARQELRKVFLEKTDYKGLIMLDDDADLDGNGEIAKYYLNKVLSNKDGWCEYQWHLLKLLYINRDIYSQITIPNGGADDGDSKQRYFEDQWFIAMLRHFWGDREVKFPPVKYGDKSIPMSLLWGDKSNSAYDTGSVWHDKVYDGTWTRHDTGNQGRLFTDKLKKMNDASILTNTDKLSDVLRSCAKEYEYKIRPAIEYGDVYIEFEGYWKTKKFKVQVGREMKEMRVR